MDARQAGFYSVAFVLEEVAWETFLLFLWVGLSRAERQGAR